MKNTISKLVTILLIICFSNIYADNDTNSVRKFQFSFVSPVSTNGMACGRIVNQFSINLLVGYSAGTDGLEFGGLMNINKHFTHGVQAAGFANYSGGGVSGLQAAGFCNITADSVSGLQAAGFCNFTRRSFKGIQVAGNNCVTLKKFDGAQLSGFANYASELKGIQAAGFLNLVTGNVRGIQISGFLNYAKRVDGLQIGIFNIADTVKGASIGLFSFVRKGYRRYEIAGNEVFYLNAAFKTGTRSFYNIFSAGARYGHGDVIWGAGYGIGTEIGLGKRFFMNLEGRAYYLSYNNHLVNAPNLLNRINIDFGMTAGKHIEFFVGGAYNLYVTKWRDPETHRYGFDIAPYLTYNETTNATNIKMWFCGQAGIRLKEF